MAKMAKRFPHAAVFSTAVLAAGLLFVGAAGAAETPPKPEEKFKDIKAVLEKIRKLKFKRKVFSQSQSLDEFKKFIEKDLEKEFPRKQRMGMIKGLKRLGIIDCAAPRPFASSLRKHTSIAHRWCNLTLCYRSGIAPRRCPPCRASIGWASSHS